MVLCGDCLEKPQELILQPYQGYPVLRSKNEVDVGSVENGAYPILARKLTLACAKGSGACIQLVRMV